MAAILDPGIDPEFRKRWGLVDDAGPVSGQKMTFEKGRARQLAGEIPSPGLSQRELDRKLDGTMERAKVRERDAFSIPAADNRIELLMKSWPGARNDTKKYIPGSAPFGNFLFGAEAAAAGLSEEEALGWARAAQVAQDVMKGQWPSGKDNPDDPEEISKGYRYSRERSSIQNRR